MNALFTRHPDKRLNRRLLSLFTLCVLLAALLSACAQPAAPPPSPQEAASAPEVTTIVETVEVMVEGEMAAVAENAPAGAEQANEPRSSNAANDANDGASQPSLDTANLPVSYNPAEHMVIKDAQMELLVKDSFTTVEQVTQLAASQGGYIIDSKTWYVDDYMHATLRLGIPVGTFEATFNTLRKLGLKVINETATGQDVSAAYADLESRLANLEATSARVREFLDDSKTVEESLRINAELSELEGQIEQVKGQMKFYRDRSSFSTITVTLTPEIPVVTPAPTPTPTPTPTPVPPPTWDPGKTYRSASGVMVKLLQSLADMAIWTVIVFGPIALLIALVWWVSSAFVRRLPKPPVRQ